MCVHCLDNGLGVTGSADDVLSVFMITEMVRSVTNAASAQNLQMCTCINGV